jgi:hypothetical protein
LKKVALILLFEIRLFNSPLKFIRSWVELKFRFYFLFVMDALSMTFKVKN